MKTQNIGRWTGIAAALLFALLAPAHGAPAPQAASPPLSVANSIVSVDFGKPVAHVHSMVGFLHGSNATTPGDDRLLPLHPALWRIGYMWMQNRDRLAKLHVPTILILSDSWGSRVPKTMGEWDGFVHAMVKNANGLPFTWDVMNEPDLSYSFKGTPEQYSEMFAHASQILHAQLGPQTAVSGPSISHYDPQYLANFLDYCKAHGAQVDVLSWHELNDDTNVHAVTEHLRDARRRFLDNPAYKGLGIQKIEINEIVGPAAQYEPAAILGYFDALEQGGADGACKGCWDDNCANNTLGGLVTPDTHAPRAAWWAYKSYADTVAARVLSRAADPRVVSFAASGSDRSATVLVGCLGEGPLGKRPVTVSLRLTGLHRLPFARAGRRVHLRVERIPDAGKQPVDHLEVVQERDAAVARGMATALLPPLTPHEADLITLSRTP